MAAVLLAMLSKYAPNPSTSMNTNSPMMADIKKAACLYSGKNWQIAMMIIKTNAISKPRIEPTRRRRVSNPTIQSTDLSSSMKNFSATIIRKVPPKAEIGPCASPMMREYSSGSDNAMCIAANGLIHAKIATIAKGNTMRMPKTAINMPHVKNRRCQTGVISSSLFAFTIALSKDRAISNAAKIAPTKRKLSMPPYVPVVAQPSHPDSPRPITVTIRGHF